MATFQAPCDWGSRLGWDEEGLQLAWGASCLRWQDCRAKKGRAHHAALSRREGGAAGAECAVGGPEAVLEAAGAGGARLTSRSLAAWGLGFFPFLILMGRRTHYRLQSFKLKKRFLNPHFYLTTRE